MSFFQEYLDDLVMEKVADYLTEQTVQSQRSEEAALRKARQELLKDKKFINASDAGKKTMLANMYSKITGGHSGASLKNYTEARGYTHAVGGPMNLQDEADFGTAGFSRKGAVTGLQLDSAGKHMYDPKSGGLLYTRGAAPAASAGVTAATSKARLAARQKRMDQLGQADHLHDIGYRRGEGLGATLKKHAPKESIIGKATGAAQSMHEYLKSKGKYAPHAAYGAAGAAALGGGAYLYNRNKKKR